GGIQAWIFLAKYPFEGCAVRGGGFDHLLVADIDFRLAVDAFDPGAETLALAAVKDLVDDGTQCAADPALWNLGAVLSPISFHQACAGILRVNRETLFAPKIDNLGINFFCRLVNCQPAQIAGAHDAYAAGGRQDAVRRATALLSPLALLVLT